MARLWQIGLSERIDPSRPGSLYMQIIQAVIFDIESGRLLPGTWMPSSRDLSRALGVNRKTVVVAYEDLAAQGWLVTSATRGTMISDMLPDMRRGAATDSTHERKVAGYRFVSPPDRPLALGDGPGFKLDEGTPDGRLISPQILARAHRTAIHRAARRGGLQYRDPRGSQRLRAEIARILRVQRGLMVGETNICITRGSQNGLFLAAQILVAPGDAVVVEELCYEPAVAALRALGAKIVPVGVDDGGTAVEDVERACREHDVRAIFLTPHHQFPTTVALRPERRLQLAALARHYGFAIVEDDYDHEYHFESQPLLPLAAHTPEQTLYVGSLSKLLLPALRIGYIAAPEAVIEAIAHRVSLTDGMGNILNEEAAAELIDNGELRRHVRKAKLTYADRRAHFAATIDTLFGASVDYRLPDGGLAFWLRFRTDMDAFERRAANVGLRFAASRSFMVRDSAPRGLRIGFASLDRHEQRAALGLLREALP